MVNSTNCKSCPNGYTSDSGSAACNNCAPGKFSNATGQTEGQICKPCTVPGEYQDLEGQDKCKQIQPGFENSGATTQLHARKADLEKMQPQGVLIAPQATLKHGNSPIVELSKWLQSDSGSAIYPGVQLENLASEKKDTVQIVHKASFVQAA